MSVMTVTTVMTVMAIVTPGSIGLKFGEVHIFIDGVAVLYCTVLYYS